MVIARTSDVQVRQVPAVATPPKLERGQIKTVSSQKVKKQTLTPPQISVPFLFNPTELTIKKSNAFQVTKAGKTSNNKELEFGGGEPKEVTIQLFFDTLESHDPSVSAGEDVRKFTDKLLQMMMIPDDWQQRKIASPPQVELEWGQIKRGWHIPCYITSMTQKFTLFAPDGTPVRATVDLSLKVADDARLPGQNPTSGSDGYERTRMVMPGDRLDLIAHQEYGDSGQWRAIADANRLTGVRDLPVGRRLAIPDIS
jgi:nucleoid-associated protein YgaU